MSVKVNSNLIGNYVFPVNERIFNNIKNVETSGMRGLCSRDFLGRDVSDSFIFHFKYETDIDFTILYVAKKYLDDKYPSIKKSLYMYYVPYARMDRETETEICTIKYICQMINDLNFSSVLVVDPHSNVTPALLNHCEVIYPFAMHENIILNNKIDYILFPDLGASKKYSSLHKYSVPFINGHKVRKTDSTNNQIIEYDILSAPSNLDNTSVLIIDDICSAGTTFLNAGKILKDKYNVNDVYLFTTFTENNIYNGEMINSKYIDKIYTTNFIGNHNYINKKDEEYDSCQDINNKKIIVLDF